MSVLSSLDCEELLRHKGLNGGLLELLRPFGEVIPGRIVIRDSTGASRALDDFGIRFTGIKDGLEAPRLGRGRSESTGTQNNDIPDEYRPARLRSGGDVPQIEQLVERELDSQENRSGTVEGEPDKEDDSVFTLYERKLLSGTILSPHETFAHPVALVIAISSRSAAPIEELRNLYAESNSGAYRLPPWVNNEYIRYYVLVHDEDYDDIKKSTTLYEQMKRHFGLHCHLLRLRSAQCTADSTDAILLPSTRWSSAAEDLAAMTAAEEGDSAEDAHPHIFESDAIAIRSLVREMVTQSIIPSMERLVATWNDQVASRRRGISGRFMSLSKRFTPFGSRSNSPTTSVGSNYDSAAGVYRSDSPEALMRKLADYAMMLRDYKLAQSTYEILCGDFKGDKAWRYYAGANEMAAISSLLISAVSNSKPRIDTVDTWIENAYYSYFSRCNSPFFAVRAVIISAEFLKARNGTTLDEAAKWFGRLLEDRTVGPVGHALIQERIGRCYAAKTGAGELEYSSRRRKAGFWMMLATHAWLDMDKTSKATDCLDQALRLYEIAEDSESGAILYEGMQSHMLDLESTVRAAGSVIKAADLPGSDNQVELIQQTTVRVDQRSHKKSISIAANTTTFDPLGAVPLSPNPALVDRKDTAGDGFE